MTVDALLSKFLRPNTMVEAPVTFSWRQSMCHTSRCTFPNCTGNFRCKSNVNRNNKVLSTFLTFQPKFNPYRSSRFRSRKSSKNDDVTEPTPLRKVSSISFSPKKTWIIFHFLYENFRTLRPVFSEHFLKKKEIKVKKVWQKCRLQRKRKRNVFCLHTTQWLTSAVSLSEKSFVL